jgi:tetratricopeptide (TPR) repeat protein
MIGKTISHYKVIEELGRGGMGVVYKAQDLTLDRFVAIKFLPPHLSGDEEARARFIHEAKAASALNHPNIGIVHEIDRTEDGHTFMVMAHYEGESLRDRIDRGNITVEEALDITTQIATGLCKAHGREIVHRDIKPSNVLLTKDGHAVIIDFGLAKLSGKTRLTKEGSTLGTAAFMSPEQAQGMEVDQRSDIFSVGTMLYEMLAGEPPFKGEHEAALLYGIVHETPEPVSAVKPELPTEIDLLIDKCLAKDRSERYQTAEELLADLGKLKEGSAEGIGIARSEAERRAATKRKYMLAWGIPLVILAAILIALKIWAPGQSPDDTAPARPAWILVAEFEGPRDDPDLAPAVRELVTATLNESNIVRPLSHSDLERGLQQAMKPDTTRIAGGIAQELAYRAGARIYIEGNVAKIGSGYSIVLNVMDSETGSYVFPVSGTAEKADAIIPAIGRLNRELRSKLGENAEAIEATREASDITTPSFDAFQKYVQAIGLMNRGKQAAGIELMKEALDLDPDFAAAWAGMGVALINMGRDDDGLRALEEALERPERLSEMSKAFYEALIEPMRCDSGEGLEHMDILVSRYKQGYNLRGCALLTKGRLAEAVDMFRNAIETAPFGPNDIVLYNMTVTLIFLGRYDETGEYIRQMPSQWVRSYMQLLIASATSDWARADSMAENGEARLRSREKYRASRDAARGSMRSAAGHCDDDMFDGEYITFDHNTCYWTLQLSAITGMDEVYCCWPECRDSSIGGFVIQVMEAAHSGDTASARSALDSIRQRSDCVQRNNAGIVALAEANFSAANNRWDEIVQRLEPVLEQYRPGLEQGVVMLSLRWALADAFEKQGELERAAEQFELVLSPEMLWSTSDYLVRPSYCTYAHHRLALIYSKLGQVEKAKRHWEAFREVFTDPDPELEPMLAEAQAAIARLEEQP